MRGLAALLALLALLPAPGAAHHVGSYVPQDNEVSLNFKQITFSLRARKFDVALRLFEGSALRREMIERTAMLPAGLEAGTRAALQEKDAREVERALMLFFAALARDLAREADRQLAQPGQTTDGRLFVGDRFLEAIWRYYNLIDFAVSTRHAKASVAMRLAFDEAETYAKSAAAPAAVNPCSGPKRPAARTATPDPDKLRGSLQRIAQILSDLIEESTSSARRGS